MNPLIGIAMGLAPDIIKLIAGDKTGQLADQVGKIVSDTVGTTNAGEAQTKLAANPAAEAAVRQKLAELAIEATKAQNADASQRAQDALADTQGARSGLQALATTNSTIAWTAPTISYLVIAGFFAFLFVLVWLYWGKPADNQNNFIVQIINIAVGALTAAFATVINFWLGSSAGSRKKDDANLSLQQAQAQTSSANMKSLQDKINQQPQSPQAPAQATPAPAARVQTPAPAKPADQQGSSRFDACMPFIFKAEGGYSDNPADPGGPTNFGITLATLRAYDGNPNLTADDVKKLTPAVAKEIYRTAYWNRMQCGALPAGLDLEVFDFGVNSGPSESVKTLQRLVGVTQDGSVGPITLAAVAQFNVGDLIGRFAQARLAFYQGLNMPEFEQGWATRVAQIQTAAATMFQASEVATA
jgi:lysozyme family protein